LWGRKGGSERNRSPQIRKRSGLQVRCVVRGACCFMCGVLDSVRVVWCAGGAFPGLSEKALC
jgi:hypothetical protein